MILPIYTYGSPVLREETVPVEQDSPELQRLIDDMIETMHGAEGIGLAAPQVGRAERLFVVDLSGMAEDLLQEYGEVPEWAQGPQAFVNPEVLEDEDVLCEYEEGCLSIPDLREQVTRPDRIRVRYRDRRFQEHEIEADGLLARVIQHENDHLYGVLFVDHLSPLRRRLLRRRLRQMAAGDVEAEYPLAGPVEPERA
ncbi:MAG: peptide deformylase [Rhodothermales bacterium]|nr:peptide deformylase [Rhodothermales bacterium]